jgi:hypothetical protein
MVTRMDAVYVGYGTGRNGVEGWGKPKTDRNWFTVSGNRLKRDR